MIATVSKSWTFEAAHDNPHHPGACRRVHGHTYEIRVWARGHVTLDGPETGMVVDFGRLSNAVQRHVLDVCDHRYLNEVLPESFPATTVEWLAWHFLNVLHIEVPEVCRVRLQEGRNAYAEVEA